MKVQNAIEQAYKNGYARGYEDRKRDACPKGSSPTQKIKTGFARIIVDMIADKPYFSILYLEPKDGTYHIGYSSYELQNVIAWRSEYFEIGEEEITFPYPVKHGQWAHLGGDEWCCTECGNVITTEGSWEKPTKKYCNECGAKMDSALRRNERKKNADT